MDGGGGGGVCDHSSTGSESAKGQTKEAITRAMTGLSSYQLGMERLRLRFIAIRVRPFT